MVSGQWSVVSDQWSVVCARWVGWGRPLRAAAVVAVAAACVWKLQVELGVLGGGGGEICFQR